MRCLIVDDEPLAHTILSDYIRKIPFLTLVGATTSPIDALTQVQQGTVDVLLLDIQMPELTGIQFLNLLRRSAAGQSCRVILTTAYSEYALEGYEHEVVDYLLKPISFERFYRAMQKLLPAASPAVPPSPVFSTPLPPPPAQEAGKDFIFVKTDYRLQRIGLDELYYVEGLKDYVSLYTFSERILALQTMKTMEEKLPAPQFMRVHKSYIVALNRIESVERNRIYLGKAIIPLGDTYRDVFYRQIDR